MRRIIKVEKRYGVVSIQEHLNGKHREHCLCWQNCKFFKPNTSENCPIASALYAFDINHNVTTPVWECAKYESSINFTDEDDIAKGIED